MKSKKFVPYHFTRMENISWYILGLLICLIGAGIPYIAIYGYFFMHDEFINRWRLLRRLKNGFPPLLIERRYYSLDDEYVLVVSKNNKVSLHYKSDQDCIVCTFVPNSILDKYVYDSIIKECRKGGMPI